MHAFTFILSLFYCLKHFSVLKGCIFEFREKDILGTISVSDPASSPLPNFEKVSFRVIFICCTVGEEKVTTTAREIKKSSIQLDTKRLERGDLKFLEGEKNHVLFRAGFILAGKMQNLNSFFSPFILRNLPFNAHTKSHNEKIHKVYPHNLLNSVAVLQGIPMLES